MPLEPLIAYCSDHGMPLSQQQIDHFLAYEEDFYAQNEVMNLTRVPREECAIRHFVDSLLISPYIPKGALVCDIGAGPGLPAWPLACTRPDLHVTALDSSGKMIGFLQRHPLPNLETVLGRAEEWGVRDRFDVATGRALAPLGTQLELSAPTLKVGGFAIPFRTPNDLKAIESFYGTRLGLKLRRTEKADLPGTDIVRIFPIFEKMKPTPLTYPRNWAQIRKSPL